MSNRAGLLLVALLVLGASAAAVVASAGTQPRVDLAVEGESIADGEYRLVTADPSLTVDASVGSNASSGATIRTVVVRVNGQTIRSYDPGTEETSITVDLPLDRGNNTVRIIVEDSADRVVSRRFRLAKDDIPPWIGLTAPYSTDVTSVIPNGTVNRSVVEFGVRVDEYSGLRRARIDVGYDREGVTGSDSVTVPDPPYTFSRDLLLGYGNNSVRISATDETGKTRIRRFTVRVVDRSSPAVSLDLYPNTTTARAFDLSGTVTDNVWIRNVTIHVRRPEANNETQLVNRTFFVQRNESYRYSRANREIELDEWIPLLYGPNEVRVTATDHRGNRTERRFTVERVRAEGRTENRRPTIQVDRNRSRIGDEGRLRLVATVEDPDWNLQTIAVESEANDTGRILDFEQFGGLADRPRVTLNTTLRIGDRDATVRLRAIDAADERDLVSFGVDGRDRGPLVTPTPTPTPAPTPTPTSTPVTTPTPTPTPAPVQGTTTPVGGANATAATPANATGNTSAKQAGGLPLIGSLPSLPLGAVAGIAPFVLGAVVFLVGGYVVFQRVGGEGE